MSDGINPSECPYCGSSRLGGIGSGTVHCYNCQTSFDEDEMGDEDDGDEDDEG